MSTSSGIRRFYRDRAELDRIHENLKLTRCPHCGLTGHLIFNGKTYGYRDDSDLPQMRRQRVICSNRKAAAAGCGKSHTLFAADTVPGLQVLTKTLWLFASLLLTGLGAYAAFRQLSADFHCRAASRWREKFRLAQSYWRVALCRDCIPLENPADSCPLRSSLSLFPLYFPTCENPFTAYQESFHRAVC